MHAYICGYKRILYPFVELILPTGWDTRMKLDKSKVHDIITAQHFYITANAADCTAVTLAACIQDVLRTLTYTAAIMAVCTASLQPSDAVLKC